MGLTVEYDGSIDGYEAVPLVVGQEANGTRPGGGAVLRRRTVRPSKRAVVYVHCFGDSFVPDEAVDWYTHRGFHFYAADLREVSNSARGGQDGNVAAGELGEYLAFLDGAAAHVRAQDAIGTVVMCAHGAGALVAALWCHARREGPTVDALVLTNPDLGAGTSWLGRARAPRPDGTAPARPSPLVASAQRRLRHGLDISCPVLVMCPASAWDVPGGAGGLLARRPLAAGRANMRLGEHVTWLKLQSGTPGEALPPAGERRRFFDELGRWLGAYLSWQIRDQLL